MIDVAHVSGGQRLIKTTSTRRQAIYVAVLPRYRQACIDVLLAKPESAPRLFASASHLDPSVTTGIRSEQYANVSMVRIAGRAFIQLGHWSTALSTPALIVDLNPRSITSWLMLTSRRFMRHKRTLTWGHLFPQGGANSSTAILRRIMRRLADGMIVYTHSDVARARLDMSTKPVWVAPNSLYRAEQIVPAVSTDLDRRSFLYVGRFEAAKKVHLVIDAFALFVRETPAAKLVLVGGGAEEVALRDRVRSLGIADSVTFTGWCDDPALLSRFYAAAVASVSPGFAGLGLTQSLGFGIPMIVSQDEPHSPEIELATEQTVIWAASDDVSSWTEALKSSWSSRASLPMHDVSRSIRRDYSAERMAAGLADALAGEQEKSER